MPRTMDDLRQTMFEIIDGVRNHTIPIKECDAISRAASVIVSTSLHELQQVQAYALSLDVQERQQKLIDSGDGNERLLEASK